MCRVSQKKGPKTKAYTTWTEKNRIAQTKWKAYYAEVIRQGLQNKTPSVAETIKNTEKINKLYDAYQEAVSNRTDAWNSYIDKLSDYHTCKNNAYRDCDNDGRRDDCQTKHTQSTSSTFTCECHCGYGKYGCECGSCSTVYNN